MARKYKVYAKELGAARAVLVTADYGEACEKEKELAGSGVEAFVWEV